MADARDDEIQLLSSSVDNLQTEAFEENTLSVSSTRESQPILTNKKKFHLYVISASEDRETVHRIVQELESNFGIKCLFSDRDFLPGKEIRLNIMEGMNDSMKNLMILTPNFAESHYCLHESEIAYQMALETGMSNTIPVLLQDCDIPYSMIPKTYINATLPGMTTRDIAYSIREAFVTADPAGKVLPVKLTDERSKYKNGVSVDIEAKLIRCCSLAPTRYKFRLTNSTILLCKAKNMEVTGKQLQRCLSLLNDHPVLHEHDCAITGKLCLWGTCFCPFFVLVAIAIYVILVLITKTDRPPTEPVNDMRSLVVFLLPIIGLPFCLFLCMYGKRRTRKNIRNVRDKLWREITVKSYRKGLLFSFRYSNEGTPTLRVMKYDVRQCQAFIMTLLESRNDETETNDMLQNTESQAENIIQRYLKMMCEHNNFPWDWPEADFNRHNVVKDRMCLCQCFEHSENL